MYFLTICHDCALFSLFGKHAENEDIIEYTPPGRPKEPCMGANTCNPSTRLGKLKACSAGQPELHSKILPNERKGGKERKGFKK